MQKQDCQSQRPLPSLPGIFGQEGEGGGDDMGQNLRARALLQDAPEEKTSLVRELFSKYALSKPESLAEALYREAWIQATLHPKR